jgi:hypothetical protein
MMFNCYHLFLRMFFDNIIDHLPTKKKTRLVTWRLFFLTSSWFFLDFFFSAIKKFHVKRIGKSQRFFLPVLRFDRVTRFFKACKNILKLSKLFNFFSKLFKNSKCYNKWNAAYFYKFFHHIVTLNFDIFCSQSIRHQKNVDDAY